VAEDCPPLPVEVAGCHKSKSHTAFEQNHHVSLQ
jgi:hypothetical protein